MEYIFRNKDVDCFSFSYNEKTSEISQIIPLEGFHTIPLILQSKNCDILRKYLFFYRPIPLTRPNFKNMFSQSIDLMSLYDRYYGLNLEDTYWIVHKKDIALKWSELNYFDNFKNDCSNDMLEKKCRLLVTDRIVKYNSPDFFTNGDLLKTWILRDNKKILLKDNSYFSKTIPMLEIYTEYFAYQVASYLSLNAISYDIEMFNKKLVNSSEIFTNENRIFLPFSVLVDENNKKKIVIEKIKKIYGKEQFEDLMVFDALIFNVDRHLGNFGVLADPKTLQKIDNAPIFDNGKSLIYDFNIYKGKIGKEYIYGYASNNTKLYQNFDVQLMENIQKRHLKWLNALFDFDFKNHPIYHPHKNYFNMLRKTFKLRIKQALKIFNKKFVKKATN